MRTEIQPEANFLYHQHCEACGSSDANGVFDDGHTYCFACKAHKNNLVEGAPRVTTSKTPTDLLPYGKDWWVGRKVDEETSSKFGYYKTVDKHGTDVHVAPFYDVDGKLVAQKLRYKKDAAGKKKFVWLGDKKSSTLFGQQLWGGGGRKLVITEGEIDCLSMSQVQQNKWPVVSVPDGAQSAAKAIRDNLAFVESFEEVILMFDNDEPGRLAAIECASEVLSAGKTSIAQLPLNDPNAMLQAGKGSEMRSAMWNAKKYQPEGFVGGEEVWQLMNDPELQVKSYPYPWPMLNKKIDGIRPGELTLFTGASGSGKSTMGRQVIHHLLKEGEHVGVIALEESLQRVGWDMVGLEIGRMLHRTRAGVSEDELQVGYAATLGTGRLTLYNHRGVTGEATLLRQIRVMVKSLGCKFILLDHITIALTQIGERQTDERLLIDSCMTALTIIATELDVWIGVVAHLKRTEKEFDCGERISQSDLRGSASLEQLSWTIIGCERNQQAEEQDVQNTMLVRVCKDRQTGNTGPAGHLLFDKQTGRLNETTPPKEDKNAAAGFTQGSGATSQDDF